MDKVTSVKNRRTRSQMQKRKMARSLTALSQKQKVKNVKSQNDIKPKEKSNGKIKNDKRQKAKRQSG